MPARRRAIAVRHSAPAVHEVIDVRLPAVNRRS